MYIYIYTDWPTTCIFCYRLLCKSFKQNWFSELSINEEEKVRVIERYERYFETVFVYLMWQCVLGEFYLKEVCVVLKLYTVQQCTSYHNKRTSFAMLLKLLGLTTHDSFNLKAEFSFICQSNICPNYDQYVDKTPNNNKILDNWLISAGLHLYSCKHLLPDHRSITWKDGVSNLARRNNKMKTMCWNW